MKGFLKAARCHMKGLKAAEKEIFFTDFLILLAANLGIPFMWLLVTFENYFVTAPAAFTVFPTNRI
jgi:hypothetical protein